MERLPQAGFRGSEAGTSKWIPESFRAFGNGRIPELELHPIVSQKNHRAHPEAAKGFNAMYEAARKDGITLRLTDSYRPYDQQVAVKRRKPGLAATPGTSMHGWGVAFDISVGGFDSKTYRWLAKNAARFGFVNPKWARRGGSKEEPWHWEFWRPNK